MLAYSASQQLENLTGQEFVLSGTANCWGIVSFIPEKCDYLLLPKKHHIAAGEARLASQSDPASEEMLRPRRDCAGTAVPAQAVQPPAAGAGQRCAAACSCRGGFRGGCRPSRLGQQGQPDAGTAPCAQAAGAGRAAAGASRALLLTLRPRSENVPCWRHTLYLLTVSLWQLDSRFPYEVSWGGTGKHDTGSPFWRQLLT